MTAYLNNFKTVVRHNGPEVGDRRVRFPVGLSGTDELPPFATGGLVVEEWNGSEWVELGGEHSSLN